MSIDRASKQRRRRRALRAAAPAAGLLAAGLLVWQGSYSAFSATTDNSGNAWASGTLVLQNNGGNGAVYAVSTTGVFNDSNLKPGATNTKCLTVSSTGTVAGTMKMYRSALADSAPSLAQYIQLTIDEAPTAADVSANCAAFPGAGVVNVVTNQPLSSWAATSYATGAGSVAVPGVASKYAYRITYTWVGSGTNATDNLVQGKSITAGFTWEMQ